MIVTTVVQDESGTKGEMVWFNQSFMLKAFEVDNYYLIFGKLAKGSTFSKRKLTVNEYERLYDGKGSRHLDKITAIYPETVGVSSKWIRSKINYIFSNINEFFSKDYLPENIRKEYDLIEISSAIRKIHIPSNFIDLDKSRERLGFDEIYTLLSKINLQIQEKQKISANPIKTLINDQECNVNEFLSNLKYSLDMPFTLTKSQQDCIVEVVTDIKSRKPMSRLIQGDVGSGKTVVATAVALSVLQNNYDVVLLCPTTVLAEQHFKTISNFLKNQKFTVKLVTGNSKIDEKESNTKPILYIGTHAILFKKAEVFRNTSLLIVDEQHRFGVEQREQLIDDVVSLNGKTHTPHFLMLTATPIPRSIAQIYFSSLDLSYIATPPNDRKKVLTFVVPENKRADSYNWIKDKIRSGNKCS
jgi:ATP-dependent DNA helicase RecG